MQLVMQRRPGRPAPLLIALSLAAATATAQDALFTTSNGAQVPTPPIGALDCRQMAGVLLAIDATGYRRGGSRPDQNVDDALLRYENSVARRYYVECLGPPGADGASDGGFGGAFNGGYGSESGATDRR